MAFRRKDSEFYWISYVDHRGKRIRESTGTTKKAKAEMIERARRDQYAFRRRRMVDPEIGNATTFGELIDWWWKNYGCHLQSPTIKGSIEKHLRPALGDLPLSSFTGLALEQLLQAKATVLKPRSRNHLRAVVRRMFKVATRGGLWVGANPVDDVAIAEVPKTVASFLALDEVGLFLSACHGQYRQLFATALFTGMREGELFGLRKQDVNWKTNEITVRRSWDAETTKSRRDLVIPIAKDLMPYLRAAIASSDSELVFPNRDGRMHSRNLHVNERIRTALKAAGVIVGFDHKCRRCCFKVRRTSSTVTKCPECGFALWVSPVPKDIGIHKLRHTTGTLLSKAGVPIQIIQKVLGHADIKVTEGHYLHHDTRDTRKALDEHLRFEGLPPPASAAPVTFQAQALETAKGEGRGTDGFPWNAAAFNWSGRQDLNLRPLGPEPSALPG